MSYSLKLTTSLLNAMTTVVRNDYDLNGNINDDVTLTDAPDRANAGTGDDRILGLAGDDFLLGGEGNDRLDGGKGDDYLSGNNDEGVNIFSLSFDPAMEPQNQGDGDDVLNGGEGNDILGGGKGNDTLRGDAGDDAIYAGFGADNADGGKGRDILTAFSFLVDPFTLQGWTIDVTKGTAVSGEQLTTFKNIEVFCGGYGDDIFIGDDQNNEFRGIRGQDVINGGGGDDVLYGGDDASFLNGGAGNDLLDGGQYSLGTANYSDAKQRVVADLQSGKAEGKDVGVDTLSGIKDLLGGLWNDKLSGNGVDNHIEGGAGNDALIGKNGNDTLEGGVGNDLLNGGKGSDTLKDMLGNNTLLGAEGNDLLISGAGDDTLDGGKESYPTEQQIIGFDLQGTGGGDTLDYSGALRRIKVDLIKGTAIGKEIGADRLTSVENIMGGAGNDTIFGDGSKNYLQGGKGNDALEGRDGDDVLDGGEGNNSLHGGKGNDRLFFDLNTVSVDGGSGRDEAILQSGGFKEIDLSAGVAKTKDHVISFKGIEDISLFRATTLDETDHEGEFFNKITGSDQSNRLQGGKILLGKGGDDILIGSSERGPFAQIAGYFLDGGAGNDTLNGYGYDTLRGGAGNDVLQGNEEPFDFALQCTADFGDALKAVTCDLFEGTASGADIGVDRLLNITNVIGGKGNDVISGNSLDNDLKGGAGNDVLQGLTAQDIIHGGRGNDILDGGTSNDQLYGEQGADVFVFHDGDSEKQYIFDVIHDFSHDEGDQIKIDFSGPQWDVVKGGISSFVSFENLHFTKDAKQDGVWIELNNSTFAILVKGDHVFAAEDFIFGA